MSVTPELIYNYYSSGHSLDETAEVFGLTKSQVRYRLQKHTDVNFHPGSWGGSRYGQPNIAYRSFLSLALEFPLMTRMQYCSALATIGIHISPSW